MLRLGEVTLTYTNVYLGVLWIVAGILCSLLTDRYGVLLAGLVAAIVAVIPTFIDVNLPRDDIIAFLPYGRELDRYFDELVIPVFGAIIGALIGELIVPTEYEE